MIQCARCKTENEDHAKFCGECGNDLTINVDMPTNEELNTLAASLNAQMVPTTKQPFNQNKAILQILKRILGGMRKTIFFRKKKNTIVTCSSVFLAVVLAIGGFNYGYIAFVAAYSTGQYDTAKQIQSRVSNREGANIENYVSCKTKGYYAAYAKEKLTFEEVNEKFEIAGKFCSNEEIKNRAAQLQASKEAFARAQEYMDNDDTYHAAVEYLKVIEEDSHYVTARDIIYSMKAPLKYQVVLKLEACEKENDYVGGLQIISDMEQLFSDDPHYMETYKEKFEKLKLKDTQEVKVLRAYTYHDRYDPFRKGTAVIQNCSDKVLKLFHIAFLMFDDNDNPVEVAYDYQGEGNCQFGWAEAYVPPEETFGEGYYWKLPNNATQVKACVISAEFEDGSTWENPYRDHWYLAESERY